MKQSYLCSHYTLCSCVHTSIHLISAITDVVLYRANEVPNNCTGMHVLIELCKQCQCLLWFRQQKSADTSERLRLSTARQNCTRSKSADLTQKTPKCWQKVKFYFPLSNTASVACWKIKHVRFVFRMPTRPQGLPSALGLRLSSSGCNAPSVTRMTGDPLIKS